jgi:hypothetical protein
MPLDLPNLDDRRYADLVDEALAMIPANAPGWTNHNPSDPGITLIELFAFMTEMLLFRLNRVTPENVLAFLRLLNGEPLKPGTGSPEELAQWQAMTPEERAQLIAATIRQQRKNERAVTRADFEGLALAADSHVARARCLPGANGVQRLIVLVKDGLDTNDKNGYFMEAGSHLAREVIDAVRTYLETRCLLTTRVQVQAAKLCTVRVRLTAKLALDAVKEKVKDDATQALQRFLDPLCGGHDGKGWPFGRAVYVSELYALLDRLPGIEYLEASRSGNQALDEVVISDSAKRVPADKQKRLIAITLEENELVYLDPAQITIDMN